MFETYESEIASPSSTDKRQRRERRAERSDVVKFAEWEKKDTVLVQKGIVKIPEDIYSFPGCGCPGGNHSATRGDTGQAWKHYGCRQKERGQA